MSKPEITQRLQIIVHHHTAMATAYNAPGVREFHEQTASDIREAIAEINRLRADE